MKSFCSTNPKFRLVNCTFSGYKNISCTRCVYRNRVDICYFEFCRSIMSMTVAILYMVISLFGYKSLSETKYRYPLHCDRIDFLITVLCEGVFMSFKSCLRRYFEYKRKLFGHKLLSETKVTS